MAKTLKITRVVGNKGRAAGSLGGYKRAANHRPSRSNVGGGEILVYNLATGNPGARKGNMSTKKATKKAGVKKYVKNTGKAHHKAARHHLTKYRRNTGAAGSTSIGGVITTSTFVIVGALGSKLGAQLVLGANNTGVIGYAGNLAVGGVLWFLADRVMKNRTAASGVIAGTVAQLILRLINDYTPFGSYVSQLGMGDYQMQSFVTPQILVDPMNNADIAIPAGWGAPPMALPAPAAAAAAPASGVGGLYSNFGRRGGLYGN